MPEKDMLDGNESTTVNLDHGRRTSEYRGSQDRNHGSDSVRLALAICLHQICIHSSPGEHVRNICRVELVLGEQLIIASEIVQNIPNEHLGMWGMVRQDG
jgi:hypothetical protein